MFFGTWLSGRLCDAYYRKIRDDLVRQARSNSEKDIDPKAVEQDPSFPIEKARLQILPCIMFVYIACVIGYGWSLQSRVTIAVPLVLQVISKFVSPTLYFNGLVSHRLWCSWPDRYSHNERYSDSVSRPMAQPRILDHRVCTSAATREFDRILLSRQNNIVRCLMGAGMVSIINPILIALGEGWTYTLLGGLCVLVSPLMFIQIQWAPVWRERRRRKAKEQAELQGHQ
jgi:hypothetical protein